MLTSQSCRWALPQGLPLLVPVVCVWGRSQQGRAASQGEPEDIAKEKCRLAAEQVSTLPRPSPVRLLGHPAMQLESGSLHADSCR